MSLASAAQTIQLMGRSHRSRSSCPRTCYGSPLPTGPSLNPLGVTLKADPTLALVHSSGKVCPGARLLSSVCLCGLFWQLSYPSSQVVPSQVALLPLGQLVTCPLLLLPPRGRPRPEHRGGLPHPYLQLFPQSTLLSEAFLPAATPSLHFPASSLLYHHLAYSISY